MKQFSTCRFVQQKQQKRAEYEYDPDWDGKVNPDYVPTESKTIRNAGMLAKYIMSTDLSVEISISKNQSRLTTEEGEIELTRAEREVNIVIIGIFTYF